MLRKGIFWCRGYEQASPELITIMVGCDANGTPTEPVLFSAKSGENFNHKAEWECLPKSDTGGKSFSYYPRGRVEIRNGKAFVFMNPVLNTEIVLQAVLTTFDLQENCIEEIVVKCDGSAHYRRGEEMEESRC